jgi:peptidyl-prolyl cis-trans isomerase C
MFSLTTRRHGRAGAFALLLTGLIITVLPTTAEQVHPGAPRSRTPATSRTRPAATAADTRSVSTTTAPSATTARPAVTSVRALPSAPDTRPAIRVNRTVMSPDDFDRHLTVEFRRMLMSRGIPSESVSIEAELSIRREMIPSITAKLLTRLILIDAAKAANTVVSSTEAESRWQSFRFRFPTDTILREAIESQGSNVADVRAELMNEMLIDKYLRRVITDTNVSRTEARAFYDSNPQEFAKPELVHARHILLGPDTTSFARINELKREIESGADFAAVAREHSICPSAQQGGDLGSFPREQMVAPFADAAFSCPVGKIAGPVQTEFGWHLIKVESHEAAATLAFDEVEERLIQALVRRKTQEAVQNHLKTLKDAAEIEVHTGAEELDPEMMGG